MEKDTINNMFNHLKGNFDINKPNAGHQQRFLDKLNASKSKTIKKSSYNLKIFLAVAASLVLGFTILAKIQSKPKMLDLANVSPELSQAQDFFTVTLNAEFKKLNNERSPFTEQVINNALQDIKELEDDYKQLRKELNNQSKNERIIYAMISNFQTRIDILNNVLDHIETIKQLKNEQNETTVTI